MRRNGKEKRLLKYFKTSPVTMITSADTSTKSHGYEIIPQTKAYFRSTHHQQIHLLR